MKITAFSQHTKRCQSNYKTLKRLIPDINHRTLAVGAARKSRVDNFMDLTLDVLGKASCVAIIALSHYYPDELSGKMIPDLGMTLRVFFDPEGETGFVEALSFQDRHGYHQVYRGDKRYYPGLRKSLNQFLGVWLKDCLGQGHDLSEKQGRD